MMGGIGKVGKDFKGEGGSNNGWGMRRDRDHPPQPHRMAHKCPQLQLQGTQSPLIFVGLQGHCAHKATHFNKQINKYIQFKPEKISQTMKCSSKMHEDPCGSQHPCINSCPSLCVYNSWGWLGRKSRGTVGSLKYPAHKSRLSVIKKDMGINLWPLHLP